MIVPDKPSLRFLQILARNEEQNMGGVIKRHYYGDINYKAILTLKDLVKHTILIGKTQFVAEGGYGGKNSRREFKSPREAFVVDLAGAQFEQKYNYGRNLVISSQPPASDEEPALYERLTGDQQPSFAHIKQQIAGAIQSMLSVTYFIIGRAFLFTLISMLTIRW